MDDRLVLAVLQALEREGVEYVVFGGVALNLLGLARATEDLDLFIAPRAENVERLKRALFSVFEDDAIAEIAADDLLGDYPAVQYVPPVANFHVDILTRLGEAIRYADLESQRIEFMGTEVTVVTPRTLYTMKRDTVRPQDRVDAGRLAAEFGLEDN